MQQPTDKSNDPQLGRQLDRKNARTVRITLLVVVLMFGFGFALIPIYNTVCKWLGINGKTEAVAATQAKQIKLDKSRTISLQFIADLDKKLPWKFTSLNPEVTVHPGEQKKIAYLAKNVSGRDMTGLAKFNISPVDAGRYIRKIQCFCFRNQKLKNGEEKEMDLVFVVDPKLPKRIKHIVLTYEFVNTGKKVARGSDGSQKKLKN